MNSWYSAVLIFEAEVAGKPSPNALCEASIRVFEAPDLSCAEEKATKTGPLCEHGYVNENGENVHWHFREVLEVQTLDEATIEDGMEVFSRLFRRDHPGSFGKGQI